ncbi:hypothetical protein [Sphingomonas bacterium]|nr:hypothetical protein [Sphingomonas bacterium]
MIADVNVHDVAPRLTAKQLNAIVVSVGSPLARVQGSGPA